MADHVFSATSLAFYPTQIQAVYEASGNWPSDAVDVTDEVFAEFSGAPPEDMTRGATADGQPTWVPIPPPPPPTLQQEAAMRMSQPVTVESASLPDLNANYPIDDATRQQITGIASAINAGLGLPGGGETFNWPDVMIRVHNWPATQFMAFAKEVMNYIYACGQVAQGHSGTLPNQTLSIP